MTESSEDVIRVLHVDDEPEFTALTAEFLEREEEQFTVKTAQSASDGLACLTDANFDCIVSDYDMPVQTGIEFLETVREDYPDLPFILFTGKGSEEVAAEAIEAGVDSYLQKERGTDQYTVLANRIRNHVEQYRTEQRARTLEQEYELVAETATDAFWVYDLTTETVQYDGLCCFGYDEESVDGNLDWWVERVHSDDREQMARVAEALAAGEEWAFNEHDGDRARFAEEFRFRRADGTYADCSGRGIALFEDGNPVKLVGTMTDVTEKRECERKLRETKQKLEAVIETVPASVYMWDLDGNCLLMNTHLKDILGLTGEDVEGQNVFDLVPDEVAQEWRSNDRQVVEEERTVETEETVPAENGQRTYLSVLSPVYDADEELYAICGISSDITERKKHEQAITDLHNSAQEILRAETAEQVAEIAVDTVRDTLNIPTNAVWIHDESENVLHPVAWTERATEIVSDIPMFRPGDGLIWEAFESGEVKRYDDVSTVPGRLNPDTSLRSEHILPLDDYGVLTVGSTDACVFDEIDISLVQTLAAHVTMALSHIENKETIQQERDRFQAIFEEAFDAMLIADDDGRYIDVNESATELFGLPKDELIGRSIPEFSPDDFDFETAWREFQRSEEKRGTFPLVRTDGTERIVEYGATTNIVSGEHLSVLRDVTEQEKQERELRERTRQLWAVLDSVEAAIWIRDTNSQFVVINQNFRDLFGIDDEITIKGKRPEELFPDDIAEQFRENDRRVLDTEQPIEVEERVETRQGERTFLTRITPLFEEDDLYATCGIASDITEQKEYERAVERQNERLQEFASFVSHDLRNPLNVAEGHLELAQTQCESEHLDAVARAHDRMGDLIDDLLTLAREGDQVDEMEAVDLAELSEVCWQTVTTEQATLRTETEQTIKADRSRLRQLLANLFRNAVEHGGDDVTITVGDLPDGFYVADDGPGVPDDEREKIFEPGYCTTTEGTGFGLAIVNEIAEAHGWEIGVTDSADGGTRFEITGMEVGQ